MKQRALVFAATFALACGAASPPPPPLSVISRFPGVGDANGLASGPYRVVFSRPLDPSSIGASAVRVWQARGRVPADLLISIDGLELTIVPTVTPDIPGWVWVELTGALKDRAGNPFLEELTRWTFELPPWVTPGGPGPISAASSAYSSPSLALDADDLPVVGMTYSSQALVRFDGQQWVSLQDPPSAASNVSVAGDGVGGIWQADLNAGGEVRHFTDGSWTPVGGLLPSTDPAERQWYARLVVPGGNPVLLWTQEPVQGGWGPSLHVRGWSGSAWTAWVDEPFLGSEPKLAVGPNGAIVACWREVTGARVAWIGPLGVQRIEPVPNVGALAGQVAATADLDGNPVVVFGESVSLLSAIRVKAWDGSGWRQLGGDLGTTSADNLTTPAIAMGTDGRPVVAWTQGAAGQPRQLYVARFDGTRWLRLGGPLNADPTHDVYDVALALDSRGAPVLAWPESTGVPQTDDRGGTYTVYQYHVKRLNR